MTPEVTVAGYIKLEENNYNALMYAVANVGPVAVSVDATNWKEYAEGVYDGCDDKVSNINHAVTLVGYGNDE
jgi:cathepsin L